MITKFKLPQISKAGISGKFLIISSLLLTLLFLLSSSAFAQGDVLTDPPKNYETVQGWYQGRQTHYYEFGTNTSATEDRSEVVPAPIYALVTGFDADGNPIPVEGQNNIVDVIPGDEGYSDLWQVTFVTVPEDYEANSITSAQDLIDAGYEQTVPGVYVNCPIVPAGSTLSEGGELTQGWYKGQEVFYFNFDQPTVQTAPIYAFITGFNESDEPIFVEGQNNIIDVIPGDENYSSFWDVQMVVVPEDYEANSVTSAEEVMAGGYDIMPAGLLVNCPVIRTDDAVAATAEESAAMAEETTEEETAMTEETTEETTEEAAMAEETTTEEAPATTEETPADLPATGGPGSSFPLWLAVIAGGLVLLGLGFVLRSTAANKA